jgi:RNA polymerase sigma-70 factor (family 1)
LIANTTDPELITLISEGNKDAFSIFYTRNWMELYKMAFAILKDRDACVDLIQDIFVWIWENRQELVIASPKSYLRAAVKYKIANYIRSGNIRRSFFAEVAKFNFVESMPSADEFIELKELNNIIQKVVVNLPQKCLEIYRLSREANLSNREIAEQLGISIKTVENQITIALHRIRTTIGPHLIGLLFISILFQPSF